MCRTPVATLFSETFCESLRFSHVASSIPGEKHGLTTTSAPQPPISLRRAGHRAQQFYNYTLRAVTFPLTPTMPRPLENVWTYPRPPALQRCPYRLRILWRPPSGPLITLADTTGAYRVLETSHPPTYYLPPADVRSEHLVPSAARATLCEWKGRAAYFDVRAPGEAGPLVRARVWAYPEPTALFADIKGYLSFYAGSGTDKAQFGEWECYVEEDKVSSICVSTRRRLTRLGRLLRRKGTFTEVG